LEILTSVRRKIFGNFLTEGRAKDLTYRCQFVNFTSGGNAGFRLQERAMKKLLGSAGAAIVLLVASIMPSSAITCGVGCFGITPAIGPSLTGTFGDGSAVGAIKDDFVFTPPPPPSGYFSNSNEITVSQGFISNLAIAIYTLVGNVQQAINSTPIISGGVQLIALDGVPVLTGVSYYVEITGSCTIVACSYAGTEGLTPTPLPAALPLFATGLGLLGFWGRRRRQQAIV
jgi:hypothetical protein